MSPPLRLAVIVHGYPPAVGGVEFAVRDIAERLVSSHGFEVTVLTTNAYTNENFRNSRLPLIPITDGEVQNGVRVRRFPVQTGWAPTLRLAQGLAWRLRLPGNDRLRRLYQGPISPALRRAARTVEADAVLAASFPLNHLKYAFRPAGPPVVLLGAVHPEDAWGYERPCLLELSRQAATTVAFTEVERHWLVSRGCPPERSTVIPLAIEPKMPSGTPEAFRMTLGIDPRDYLVAYLGQQGSHKGIDALVRGAEALLAAVPSSRLAIAGSVTPYSVKLRQQVDDLPEATRRRVMLFDGVDEEFKTSLLAACDVFASPSAHESFGITTLEAWAQERPVVLGDGPAQRELTEDGRLGVLVRYGDVDGLVEALRALAAAPEHRRRLGIAGRLRLIERYTLDAVAARYRELFETLLGAPRRR